MAICPQCDSVLDIDAEEVDEGDIINCDECGSELEIVATEPLELAMVDDDDDEELEEDEEE